MLNWENGPDPRMHPLGARGCMLMYVEPGLIPGCTWDEGTVGNWELCVYVELGLIPGCTWDEGTVRDWGA